jgi:alkylation response protein AidB-like acyl-CoA dehydrogenase
VAGIQTTARPERGGYVLNGTKRFLTCAMLADLAIVVATVDRSKGHKGITLFLVEKGTPGFSTGSKEHLMGVRGMDGLVVFDSCWVPKENLLGGEEGGAMMSLDEPHRHRLPGQGWRKPHGRAVRYAGADGVRRPHERQAIQFMLADMSAGQAAGLLRHAAWLKDRGSIREAAGELLARTWR